MSFHLGNPNLLKLFKGTGTGFAVCFILKCIYTEMFSKNFPSFPGKSDVFIHEYF